MNRRKALFMSLAAGALAPGRLLAQAARRGRGEDADRPDPAPARKGKATTRPAASRRSDDEEPVEEIPSADEAPEDAPANFPEQAGYQWRHWDIGRYTALGQDLGRPPQAALVEWIFRRTGSTTWHGEKIAVLAANRAKLRAYNSPNVLDQVQDVVERFTDAYADTLRVRVRFIAADRPAWRYVHYSRLTSLARGPQGQQVWTASDADAAVILAQFIGGAMGKQLNPDQTYKMINGQTLTIETMEDREYTAGLQRSSAVGLGYQAGSDKLKEGIVLRLSPLLNYEGTGLEAAIDLRANVVRSLYHARVIAPRDGLSTELTVDVPEVSETRLNQTIKGWNLGQTLVISSGILPGILQAKAGPLNLKIPGTYPTSTELLVFINVEVADGPAKRSKEKAQPDE